MYAPYRLFGGALSPYSRKVASYLRFKGLDFAYCERNAGNAEEFAQLAKLPLLPLLIAADGSVLQDSTPLIETLEQRHQAPSITPDDAALRFVSLMIEDFADEWLNKVLYHYRWSFPEDARLAAAAIVAAVAPDAEAAQVEQAIAQVCAQMGERRALVGVSDAAAPVLESSLARTLDALQQVFQATPFLLGSRPACADFALAAQLEELAHGPTAQAQIGARPAVSAYLERMRAPDGEGVFAAASARITALRPLLEEIASVYLPWLAANAEAHFSRRESFAVELAGMPFAQAPQRYAATKAFPELRAKFTAAAEALGGEETLAWMALSDRLKFVGAPERGSGRGQAEEAVSPEAGSALEPGEAAGDEDAAADLVGDAAALAPAAPEAVEDGPSDPA